MRYKGYLIDLDGTIYKGKSRLKEAEDFIKRLQEAGIPFLFVTNNATKTPKTVQAFLKDHCGVDISADQVYTSALAALDYVKAQGLGPKSYIIGEPALKDLFLEAGYIPVKKDPDFVLQALNKETTYQELKEAALAIQEGASFIVTNGDKQYPTEEGFIPGSGAITELLKAATRVEPVIIGKPEHYIMDGALEHIGLDASQVVMVGDNYTTDILAGINYPMDTLLTLTGVSRLEDILALPKDKRPTHMVEDLSQWRDL